MSPFPTDPVSDAPDAAPGSPPFNPSIDLLRSILDGVPDGFTAFDRDWCVTYLNQASVNLLGRMGRSPEDLIGRNVWELFPELAGTSIHAEYLRAMDQSTPVEFEEYLPLLDAWFQVRLYPTPDGLLAFSQDVTSRRRTESALVERTRALALGVDVGRALTSGETLRDMLQGCAEAMVRHLDAAFARVWTLNPDANVLELKASAGLYTHIDGGHSRVPVGQFKIGLIAEERKPHLTNAVVGDPRVGDQEWARREGMVAFAGYPLLVDERLVGVAAMFARHPLSDATLEALAAVSDEIGLGIARKRAEEDLRSSREWLSTTLVSIGDAVIATDGAGRVTFMNPVAEALTGWPAADAAGRPLAEVFHIVNEVSGDIVENPVDRVLREGGVVGLANHTVLIARDGARRPIDDSAAPIRSPAGELTGVVLVFHDVTERRQAERRSEAQYRVSAALAASESLGDAAERTLAAVGTALGWSVGLMWLADGDSRHLRVYRTWQAPGVPESPEFLAASQRMTFRAGEGLPGRVFTALRPQWVENVRAYDSFPRLAAATDEGLVSGLAFPLHANAGPLGVMEFFHSELRPPDEGMLHALEGLGRQVGQFIARRRAEEDSLRNETLVSAVLSSALDCIVSMDQAGRVTEWNAQAERTFGYAREEALGQELASLIIPPALRDQHREGLARYLVTGEGPVLGLRLEITAVRSDGAEFPVELAISRIAGEPPRFTGFIRDITDRRRREEELKHAARELKEEQARQAVLMRYLRTTNRVAARIASLNVPREIMRAVIETLSEEFDAPVMALWSYDTAKQRLTLAAEHGLEEAPPESVGREIQVVMNAYKIGWVARFGRPSVGRIAEDDLQFQHDWLQAHDIAWAAIYPLKGRERLHGVLAIFKRAEVPLGGSDVLATLAAIVSGALDGAFLPPAHGSAVSG